VKRFVIFFLLIFSVIYCNAQVKLLTLKELKIRMAKGKDTTYVINFWATWCAPCVEELPYFEKLSKTYKNKPFKVILMSLDFRSKLQTEVIPFIKKHRITSEVYVVNEPDQQAFIENVDKKWSGALPATLLVSTAKKTNRFYEQSFTYDGLLEILSDLK